MVHTLKDYAIRALVNTVDHLGSVSFKVNDLLVEKVDEVSGIEQRISCIEQVNVNDLKSPNIEHKIYIIGTKRRMSLFQIK